MKKPTKDEIKAQQERAIANAQYLTKLAEQRKAELDRREAQER